MLSWCETDPMWTRETDFHCSHQDCASFYCAFSFDNVDWSLACACFLLQLPFSCSLKHLTRVQHPQAKTSWPLKPATCSPLKV